MALYCADNSGTSGNGGTPLYFANSDQSNLYCAVGEKVTVRGMKAGAPRESQVVWDRRQVLAMAGVCPMGPRAAEAAWTTFYQENSPASGIDAVLPDQVGALARQIARKVLEREIARGLFYPDVIAPSRDYCPGAPDRGVDRKRRRTELDNDGGVMHTNEPPPELPPLPSENGPYSTPPPKRHQGLVQAARYLHLCPVTLPCENTEADVAHALPIDGVDGVDDKDLLPPLGATV